MSNILWKDEYRKTGESFGVSVDDYDTQAQWEQRLTITVGRRKQERLKAEPEFAKMMAEIEKNSK